jgi:hypothetical protein
VPSHLDRFDDRLRCGRVLGLAELGIELLQHLTAHRRVGERHFVEKDVGPILFARR